MSATNYITPALGNETYTQTIPSNFGEAAAAGITSAGQSIAGAISAIGGQYLQNRQVDDTLKAMNQSKMLPDEDYEAVAGKSLGAKQTMLGMYASQFMADQAEQRQAALNKGQAVNTMTVEHQKLLDQINAVKSGYGAAAGVPVSKLPVNTVAPPKAAPVTTTVQTVKPTVSQQTPGNMILKPGVVRAQAVGPNGQVVQGWKMQDGSFKPD